MAERARDTATSPLFTAPVHACTAGTTSDVGGVLGEVAGAVGVVVEGPGLRLISDTTAQPAANSPRTHRVAMSTGRVAVLRCLLPRPMCRSLSPPPPSPAACQRNVTATPQ